MKSLKVLLAATLIVPCSVIAQMPVATFEGDELKIPSLILGDQNYKDIVIKYLGGMDFDVTQIQETTDPIIHSSSKFESGKLVVNALELGNETYANLLFDYAGGTSLKLGSFKGPVKELSFKQTDFLLVEPKEWKSNETAYDGANGVFITKRGAVLVNDFKTLDLDNDGKKDILISSTLFENDKFVEEKMPLLWLKNTGSGFEPGDPNIFPDTHARILAFSIHIADFNNDGQDDIFAPSTGYDDWPFPGEANLLLLSDSQGKLLDGSIGNLNFDYLGYTHGSDIGDINNDGYIDIATTDSCGPNGRTSGARVLVNDGQARFTRAVIKNTEDYDVPATFGKFCSGWQIALIDLNNDGYDELLIGSNATSLKEDRIYWNDKSGEFDLSKFTSIPEFKSFDGNYLYDTLAILETDLNFDGKVDIVMSKSQRYTGMGLQFLINNGDETFTDVTESYSPWLTSGPASPQAIPYWISETDINSDGLPDLKLNYDKWGDDKFPHIWLRQKDGGYEEYPSEKLPKVGWFWLLDYDLDGDGDLIYRNQIFEKRGDDSGNILDAAFEWRILENESL
ncbi:VCBS repeat-containing protein [Gammaproteobacteria bacterium]|nr:VCBS repeat-containing protein [Gammaproteobacteria bacterium]